MTDILNSLEPRPETWDAVWKEKKLTEPGPMGRRIYQEIRRQIDPAGCEVLELGCGCGELLRQAADDHARKVIGVDASSQALALAAQMLQGLNHQLIGKNFFDLPEEPLADIVWSSGVVEHFSGDRLLQIMQLHRRLSRNHVVVVVPAGPHWNDIRMRQKKTLAKFGWQRPLTTRTLRNLGRRAGLKTLGVRRFMVEYCVDSITLRKNLFSLRTRWPKIDQWFGGLAVAWYQRVDVSDHR